MDERIVGFVDLGSSHGTVSVVKFYKKELHEFMRNHDESWGDAEI